MKNEEGLMLKAIKDIQYLLGKIGEEKLTTIQELKLN
jgi:hypothetical protein